MKGDSPGTSPFLSNEKKEDKKRTDSIHWEPVLPHFHHVAHRALRARTLVPGIQGGPVLRVQPHVSRSEHEIEDVFFNDQGYLYPERVAEYMRINPPQLRFLKNQF